MDVDSRSNLSQKLLLAGNILSSLGLFFCSVGSIFRMFDDGMLPEINPQQRGEGGLSADDVVASSFRENPDALINYIWKISYMSSPKGWI